MQLIDLNIRGTPNIALAECHHLVWVLSRHCALQPGSMTAPIPSERDFSIPFPYLIFRDFEVTRSPNPGDFNLVLNIRNLKIISNPVAEQTGYHTKQIRLHIKSPQSQHNLMVSVPHRFLVLALRRGALQDDTTVQDLLDGNRRSIISKFLAYSTLTLSLSRRSEVRLHSDFKTC